MTVPQIDPWPPAPGPSDPGEVFDEKAFAFTQSLDPRRQQMNQVAQFVNDTVTQFAQEVDQAVDDATQTAVSARDTAVASANTATQAASDAESDRTAAQEARDAALAVVGFAGKWADLTGALNIPATVFHQGAYWRLLNDLADVTASEPANDNADWLFVYSNAELRRKLLDEATLYADFANGDYRLYEGVGAGVVRGKSFSDLFSFARSSDATGQGVSTLETVTADVARFVYSPELKKRQGLIIEESRTRLNTISAAPTAPENVTVTATAHTISFYGTGSVALSGVATDTLIGTGSNERVSLTFTPTAGTLTITPSGTVIDLQLEVGSFATSVIRGEGTQVTRAADNCSRTLGQEFNGSEGTLFMEASESGIKSAGGNSPAFFAIRSTTSTTYLIAGSLTNTGTLFFQTPAGYVNTGVSVVSGPIRFALSFKEGSAVGYVNGVEGYNRTFVKQEILPELGIGGASWFGAGANLSGIIRKFYVIPRALSEAELIALTQPEAE